jgi:large subunit ribosomal protein L22
MAQSTGYTAHARFVLVSPFKVRRVANIVRRKPYTEAVAILEHAPQKSAKILKKVIQSAAANALYRNKNLDEDMLFIRELQINEGPRMKRVWPRARGRADLIVKRMSHITAVVDEIAGTGE